MGVTGWPHPTPLLLRLLGGWRVEPPCNHWHRPAPRHWGPGCSQLMWSHGFLQAPALSRPLSGSNPRGARKCPRRGQSRILFLGGSLLCIPLSLSVQSTVYFLVCDCDWWSESSKCRSIRMIRINCKKNYLSQPSSSSKPAHPNNRTVIYKRVVLTSNPICKWSFILARLLCKGR